MADRVKMKELQFGISHFSHKNGLSVSQNDKSGYVKKSPNDATNSDSSDGDDSPSVLPQVFGTAVACFAQIGIGVGYGFSGVMLPQLTNSTSTLVSDLILDEQGAALFSSMISVGAAVGGLLGIIPMVYFGQRISMLFALPLCLASWGGLSFAPSALVLQSSRFIMGLAAGVIEFASYTYVTELAYCAHRGLLVGTADTMRQMGFLMVITLGSLNLRWKSVALICGCTTTIPAITGLLFLPNSPRWLVTKGKLEEAKKSLTYFRGPHYNTDHELNAITAQLQVCSAEKQGGLLDQLKLLTKKTNVKPFLLLAFLLFIVQFTGNIVVMSYIVPIFSLAEVSVSPYASAIAVAGIRVIGTVFSLSVVDKVGRRPALIVSFLFCALSLATLGIFFHLQSSGVDVSSLGWLPLISMAVFTFFTCIGHPTLNLIRGELLPTSVRSTASPLLFFIFFIGMFAATHMYPWMVAVLGEAGVFWLYGGVCLFMVIATIVSIPETRGSTLESISLKKSEANDKNKI